MISKIFSVAVNGLDGHLVEVETDVQGGLPAFTIVGLPDTAIQESRERVRSAIKNSGYDFPRTKITVNLAPADTKKSGPSFDLPIAVGLLGKEYNFDRISPKGLKKRQLEWALFGSPVLVSQCDLKTGMSKAELPLDSGAICKNEKNHLKQKRRRYSTEK